MSEEKNQTNTAEGQSELTAVVSFRLNSPPHHAPEYECIYTNGVHFGCLTQLEDGYWYFWPLNNNGAWSAIVMREIAERLDEMNANWDKMIREEVGS